jgi:glycosyltransferase involved in cell wall biosynthesis
MVHRIPWPASPAPAVSIVIPAYNVTPFIGAALESIRAQQFQDFEVILVNDGSPDTADLEAAIAPYRDGMCYFTQPNAGPSSARNAGLRQARGKYVAFLDGDDLWMPGFLADQLAAFGKDPSLDMRYTDAVFIGAARLAGRRFMEDSPSRGEVTFEALLTGQCVVLTSAVVARRDAVIDAGMFDESVRYSEDFDLWLRMAFRGARLAYCEEPLVQRRLHATNLTNDGLPLLEGQLSVYQKMSHALPLMTPTRRLLDEQIVRTQATVDLERGKRLLFAGDYEQAANYLQRATVYYKSAKLPAMLLGMRAAPRSLRAAYRALHWWKSRPS